MKAFFRHKIAGLPQFPKKIGVAIQSQRERSFGTAIHDGQRRRFGSGLSLSDSAGRWGLQAQIAAHIRLGCNEWSDWMC